jgi:ABC-type antimicrobial peptide transport system permease subunit
MRSSLVILEMALACVLLGVGSSCALAHALGGFLFGVTATDPITFAGMLIVLTTVAAMAGYIPARRASQIDPMLALRVS